MSANEIKASGLPTAAQPIALSESATVLQIIGRAASDPSTDIDKMERLMAMHERMKSQQAEQAFNAAMSLAQSQMHRVSADCTNPQTRSKYASYAALDRALRPIYTANGFSLSFNTDEAPDGWVKVVCYVSHSGGHTRTYQQLMPSDGKGAKGNDVMTKTHAAGSAMSYGMRYALKGIFNVAIGEDDTDGNQQDAPTNGYDLTQWSERLAAVKDGAGLEKAREAIRIDTSIPPKHIGTVRQMWTKRKNELAAELDAKEPAQ